MNRKARQQTRITETTRIQKQRLEGRHEESTRNKREDGQAAGSPCVGKSLKVKDETERQGKFAQPASLELGNELKNIINRAKELEQRDAVDGEFIALKQAASYSGGSIVAIVIILALVWKFWPRGRGPPLLINKELFVGTPSQALLPPTVH